MSRKKILPPLTKRYTHRHALALLAPGLLGAATTRIIYDLDRFSETQRAHPTDPTQWKPIFSATIVRETNAADLPAGQESKVQVSFTYSDGLGREIQTKIQAEPGLLDVTDPQATVINPRWVGSAWTILSNKGKPVRQYEPFFSTTHDFEFANKVGVSPTLFYDPLERVVATLHPNHTWEKVVFDPWLQKAWDVNDTVEFDPKTDPDVGNLFSLLPDSDYLPTWYQLRIDPAKAAVAFPDGDMRSAELDAANKTAVHNDTPTAALFDVLGRPFLSVAHNRFQKNGATVDEFYSTRSEFDIKGSTLSVTDALERTAMRCDYDTLKNPAHQASLEAGEHWMLNDVAGKPLYAWDSRNHRFRTAYDLLRRPTDSFLLEDTGNEIVVARSAYGESRLNPEANNLRGKLVELRDQAGVLTSEDYDFKGNPLSCSRQFLQEYQDEADWSQSPPLEGETFTSSTTYDALNRPTSVTTPENSVQRPFFNEANLLERVDVRLRGANDWTAFVTNIDYNAKGQRELIQYGNGASTIYDYDPQTFRLTRLRTTRPQASNGISSKLFQDPGVVQDLNYFYDPSGNITCIRDDALPVLHYNNEEIDPASVHTYDAIYRLVAATGREHIGQTTFAPEPQAGNLRDYPFLGLAANANDLQAMRNYTEQYDYDAVGNFNAMIHLAQNGNWTRNYSYNEASLLESGKVSNRLSSTQLGSNAIQPYSYDPHGNIAKMPHLPTMEWDFKDQLHATQQQVVNNAAGEKTYYVYDASGQRSRKITESPNGTRKKQRIYLGGFEVYREYDATGAVTLARETLQVMDDQQRIALVETRTQGNDGSSAQLIRYQFGNHLGSASLELDATGQVISYEEYYAYGSTSYEAGRNAAETSLKRYRFTGMERDEESGLNYHSARYYVTWLAKWASVDPDYSRFPTWSPFAYGFDNPIRFRDPAGRSPQDDEIQLGQEIIKHETDVKNIATKVTAIERDIRFKYNTGGPPVLKQRDVQRLLETRASILQLTTDREQLTQRVAELERQLQRPVAFHANLQREDSPRLALEASEKLNKSAFDTVEKRLSVIPTATATIADAREPEPPAPNSGLGRRLLQGIKNIFRPRTLALSTLAAVQSHNVEEFAGNLTFNILAARYPPLAAITARNDGEAGAAIVMIYVASKFPLATALVGVAAGIYKGGMALKPKKMSAPGIGNDQSWAKPWFEGGDRSGCGTCHESVRIDNAYKSNPLLKNWELLNGPASRGGIVTDQARENYMQNAGF